MDYCLLVLLKQIKVLLCGSKDALPSRLFRTRSRRPDSSQPGIRMARIIGPLLCKLSRKSDTALAVRCALGRWEALLGYVDDGRIVIENDTSERALGRWPWAAKTTCSRTRMPAWTCRRYLQPDRRCQADRHRSIGSLARRTRPHRESPHQPHRRTTVLEHHPSTRSVNVIRLKTAPSQRLRTGLVYGFIRWVLPELVCRHIVLKAISRLENPPD